MSISGSEEWLPNLGAFAVVAEELSFRRAAPRIGLSQPTPTRRMRRLETELRVKLFERHHRGIRLTFAGEVLMERVSKLRRELGQPYTSARLGQRDTAN